MKKISHSVLCQNDIALFSGEGPRAEALRQRLRDDELLYCKDTSFAYQRIKEHFDLTRFFVSTPEEELVASQAQQLIHAVEILAQHEHGFKSEDDADDPKWVHKSDKGTFKILTKNGISHPTISVRPNLDELGKYVEASYGGGDSRWTVSHLHERKSAFLREQVIFFNELAVKTRDLMVEVLEKYWPEYYRLYKTDDVVKSGREMIELIHDMVTNNPGIFGHRETLSNHDNYYFSSITIKANKAHPGSGKYVGYQITRLYSGSSFGTQLMLTSFVEEFDKDARIFYQTVGGGSFGNAPRPIIDMVCKRLFEKAVAARDAYRRPA